MKSSIYIVGIAAVVAVAIISQNSSFDRNISRVPVNKQLMYSPEQQEASTMQAEVLSDMGTQRDVYYADDTKLGTIGMHDGSLVDDPHDNVFDVYIDKNLQDGRQAYLEYELYGVEDFSSVCRSINDEVSVGGAFVKLSNEWKTQTEKIPSDQLRQGVNKVRFSIPSNNEFGYFVKNVRIRFGENVAETRQVVVNQPESRNYYNNSGYVSGYISGSGSKDASVFIGGKPVRLHDGVFEAVVEKSFDSVLGWQTEISVVFADGETIRRKVEFSNPISSDYSNGLEATVPYQVSYASPRMPVSMNLLGFSLQGEVGSVASNVELSVTGLRQQDMPLPSTGMINVTASSDGYRCLPHGNLFSNDVKVHVKYDTARIPKGYGPKDIRTFYYDDVQQDWVMLPLDSVDIENCEIISTTNHFTDFIDGILKTPESPQTQAFTPTSMKDMKYADPLAGVNMMSPPSANNSGTANMSFPIQVPAGRQGMQPQLAISYNSEGGNGFMGVGWGLNTPSISVETRWGVPVYSTTQETEEYLVNGQQVVELEITANDTLRLPLVHMESYRTRSTNSEEIFSYRVEGAFDRIIRHGTSPTSYWWEVIDKQGTHYFYGKYSTDAGVNPDCVLRDTVSGNIAHWALAEVRDVYGNYMKYNYQTITHNGSPGAGGKQLYISNIVYTGFGTTDGKYTVNFEYDGGYRSDYTISGRYGFLEVTDRLLKKIVIKYDNNFIRQYIIVYKEGAYEKKLICGIIDNTDIAQLGLDLECENLDYISQVSTKTHKFEYYEEEGLEFDDSVVTVLSQTEIQEGVLYGAYTDPVKQSLGKSTGFNTGGGGSLSFGFGSSPNKKNSIGGNLSLSFGTMKDKVTIMDINGDGISDKIVKDGNSYKYFEGSLNGSNQLVFSSSSSSISGLASLNRNKSKTIGYGGELTLSLLTIQGSASITHSKTQQSTLAYFADVNADGYVDYINDGVVNFNKPNSTNAPAFYEEDCSTIQYFAEDSCYFIIHDGQIDSAFYESDDDMSYRRDPVKVWIAPEDTKVWLRNGIIRNNSSTNSNSSQIKYIIQQNDSIIFCDSIAPSDTTLHYNDICPITAKKGDRLYFRTHSSDQSGVDDVYWDPIITSYTGNCGLYVTTVDADEKYLDIFKYSDDWLLTDKQHFEAPLSGVVQIKGFVSSPVQSDTLNFVVMHNQSDLVDTFFVDNQSFSKNFNYSISVNEGDSVLIKLLSNSNVNWNDINYDCKIQYLSADSMAIDTTNPFYSINFFPPLDMSIFPNRVIKSTPVSLSGGNFFYYPQLQLPIVSGLDGEVVFTAKSNRKLLDEQILTIQGGVIMGLPDSNKVVFTLNSNDTIYFDYYTTDKNLGEAIITSNAYYIDANGNTISANAGFHTLFPDSMRKLGNLYRGWGQFSYYDSSSTLSCIAPIDEALLSVAPLAIDTNALSQFPFSSMGSMSMHEVDSVFAAFGIPDVYSIPFTPMTADCKNQRWVDFCPSAYIHDSLMGSAAGFSSLISSIIDTSLFENGDLPMPDFNSPIPAPTNCGSSRVIVKRSLNIDNSFSFSIGNDYSSMSISENFSESFGKNDYMDMNGDRFPDLVDYRLIQYTTSQGGLSTNKLLMTDGQTSHGDGSGSGASFGVKGLKMKSTSSGQSSKSKVKNIDGSFGISNYTGISDVNYIYADVNGDGLPDIIYQKTGKVRLNIGYGFKAQESWNSVAISNSSSSSTSISLGGLLHKGNYSWSGGLGGSMNDSYDSKMLSDVNNDGLADVCYMYGNSIMALINTGHGFNSTPMLMGTGYQNTLSHTKSYNVSGNIAASIPIPLGFVKIVITPYLDAAYSLSSEKYRLTDLNGDGFLDYAYVDGDDVKVNYGIPKKVNMLKKVSTPVQSTYTVDYERTYPSRESPDSKWVFAFLKVYDGFVGDGEDTTYYKYAYSDPKYHRMERESFGYDSVTTKQYNTFDPGTSVCYRTTIEAFHNENFMFKGLKKYDAIKDGNNQFYVETYYTWDPKEISTGTIIPWDSMGCFGPYYPAISQEDKYFYEGQANYQIHTSKTYRHGRYGNVKQYINYADMTDNTDDIRAEILYNYNLSNHFLAMVSQMEVYDYQSILLRRKVAAYNSTSGRVSNIGSYDGSNYADIDIAYDSYGNISHIEYPEDVNSDRLEYSYVYDNVVFTYPISVTDYWGNTSFTTYDYRLGVPLLMTDMSNNQMAFTYYNDGKPKSVKGPNEIGTTNETIIFEYWDESGGGSSAYLWAKTRHYDPLNIGNEFVTVNFSDGLGRSIQSKQKATISGTDRMVVSGNVAYDEYGRAISVSLPTVQALGTETTFHVFTPSNFATTIFDVLDRPLEQTAPDSTTVQYDYDFGQDYFGKTCFQTTITDPNSITTTKYTDARGLNTSVTAPLNTITSFQYSPLGELLMSTDPENNQTGYIYDMMGRLVSRTHPDAGTTSYTYDMAGNVLSTQTENLAGNSQYIVYNYANCRLEHIEYPQNPEMNVYYEYGAPNTQNQSGRLVKQQDASGVQTFEYGNMGELIKNIHTFVVPNGNAYTLETDWAYDSWNRMDSITYPDGEVVSYHYNNGGQLIAMDGVKLFQTFEYISDVQYNAYGSRERIDYGNSTYAEYTYNPLNQQLTNLTSYENGGLVMQSIDYTYDNASNITQIENSSDFVSGNLGGDYTYSYGYDDLYRMVSSEGSFNSYQNGNIGFNQNLDYSASGNITNKTVNATTEIGGGLQNISYTNNYQYNGRPHTVSQTDAYTYEWDANGNMIHRTDNNTGGWRQLCWDEENRLTTVHCNDGEKENLSSYLYNAGGERVWKLTGNVMNMYINGQGYVDGVEFEKTLYVNPYLVITEEGYTKHFYIEGERVCSKIGGSGWVGPTGPNSPPLAFIFKDLPTIVNNLWEMVARGVGCSEFNPTNVFITPTFNTFHIRYTFPETDLYFYHSDHIGSSSFITDAIGYATQHLQYLPFGETFVDQQNGYDSRYTFSAKEKDDETQYSYFGARYYDSDLSVWLSVDPMADKYPNLSPFAYCLNNPVILKDPDGRVVIGSDGMPVTYEKGTNGAVIWSNNATSDIKEVGNAMLSTKFGEKAFNKWQKAATKIRIRIDENSSSEFPAETKPLRGADGKPIVNQDGQYEEAEIIFYKKKIDEDRASGSGKRFEGASYEEVLGTIGTHEAHHNEPEQIKLDKKQPDEMKQNPSKNLPINSEINFREEYHVINSGLPNENTWMQNYEKLGYEGIN